MIYVIIMSSYKSIFLGTRSAASLSLEPKIRRTEVNSFFTGLSAMNVVRDALAGGRRRKLLRFI